MLSCDYCAYCTRHFLLLCRHYRNHHCDEPNFKVTCVHLGCAKTFKTVRCLQRHVKRKHKPAHVIDLDQVTQDECPIFEDNIFNDVDGDSEQDTHYENLNSDDKITNSLAKVLLNSINGSKISKNSLFLVCENLISVSSSSHSETIKNLTKALHESGIQIDENPLLKEALQKKTP